MLYMVIEHFRPGKAPEVYRRFRERGRMAPDEATGGSATTHPACTSVVWDEISSPVIASTLTCQPLSRARARIGKTTK